MANCRVENEFGCGFIGGIFHCRGFWQRRTPTPALPESSDGNKDAEESHKHDSGKQRSNSADPSNRSVKPSPKADQNLTKDSTLVPPRTSNSHPRNQGMRPSDAARSSTSSSSSSGQSKALQVRETGDDRTKPAKASESKALAGANSGNIIPLGHLKLKTSGTGNSPRNNFPSPTMKTITKVGNNIVMGNILRHPSDEFRQLRSQLDKLDPEVLKTKGNEAYKQGKFEEALEFYVRAISLDPKNATYRSNKSAALIGLGRLSEAVSESKEAIRIDPTYYRAHHRLATLYLRLGEVEKALYHFKTSGLPDESKDISTTQSLEKILVRCAEARNLKEWKAVIKEGHSAICLGADSAPQVYAMQAEALLKLHKHQEAYATYQKVSGFEIGFCKDLLGLATTAYILMVGAQVYLVMGRFEKAVGMARDAAQLDPINQEVCAIRKKAEVVSSARLSGNLLFNASKYSEACLVYSEGLDQDPYNSVLLCNRAACRSKLAQYEKAIEDCNIALNVQPSYSKARLRRAHCNAKLERWEASIEDYEMLIRETPGDEEVGRALFEAKVQLKKERGEDIQDMNFGSNLIFVSNNDSFRHFVTSPGMSVVLFCNKTNHGQLLHIMKQVCKRFPSVNFLKVDVEEHPYLARTEGARSIPAFKIYKNGSKVKEIPGTSHNLLEYSVKMYSS